MDAIVLAVGAVATVLLWPVASEFALLVSFVLGHFFLFCNVFRVGRRSELIWAGVFIANSAAWHFSVGIEPVWVFALQLPVTAILLWLETRRPSYHGIACRRWNSGHIEAYLRGEIAP